MHDALSISEVEGAVRHELTRNSCLLAFDARRFVFEMFQSRSHPELRPAHVWTLQHFQTI